MYVEGKRRFLSSQARLFFPFFARRCPKDDDYDGSAGERVDQKETESEREREAFEVATSITPSVEHSVAVKRNFSTMM